MAEWAKPDQHKIQAYGKPSQMSGGYYNRKEGNKYGIGCSKSEYSFNGVRKSFDDIYLHLHVQKTDMILMCSHML